MSVYISSYCEKREFTSLNKSKTRLNTDCLLFYKVCEQKAETLLNLFLCIRITTSTPL